MPACTLHITVKPKSPRTAVTHTPDGVLVRVTAPPAEGAANAAVIKALAAALHIPKSRVTITAGATGRVKRVTIAEMTEEDLRERLEQLPRE